MIRLLQDSDIEQITDIYNHYVLNSIVTFDQEEYCVEKMANKIKNIHQLKLPVFVSLDEVGRLMGFAYASQWKEKGAYKQTVETTVYVNPNSIGKGIGSKLYKVLLDELKKRKIHVAIGGLSLPNEGSVALHEKFGFKKVAHFSEVGFKFGRWIDVAYWQKTL